MVRRGWRTLVVVAVLALVAVLPTGAAADGGDAPGAPVEFRGLTAGAAHNCALVGPGIVDCWGANGSGQLGRGDTLTRGDGPDEMGDNLVRADVGAGRTVVALTAGTAHTCALLDLGQVKCWGDNSIGQLGLGDTAARGDGAAEMGDALPVLELGAGRTAVSLSAGDSHTCAVLDNGSVKCWGGNGSGQLGRGDTVNRGDGPGEMGDALPAVDLGTGRTAVSVAAGATHTCAVLDNGSVKCWGDNSAGRLGLGDTAARGDGPGEMGDALPAVDLGTGRRAVAVAVGGAAANSFNRTGHTCALLDDGAVKCWGANAYGQLGIGEGWFGVGPTTARGDAAGEMGDNLPVVPLGTGRTARAVTVGNDFTCAMLDNATVKCWGGNSFGQLGLGLGPLVNKGDQPGELGDSLPPVDLGAGRTVVAVTAGTAHTCARLDDGSRKCWGENNAGQLGQGDKSRRGDGPGEMGGALTPIRLGSPVGAAVTLGLTLDQTQVVAGDHLDYHLTITNSGLTPLTGVVISDPAVPECEQPVPDLALHATHTIDCRHTSVLAEAGTFTNRFSVRSAQTTGTVSGAVIVHVSRPTPRRSTMVAAGETHTCAVLDTGAVRCWGRNNRGQLGQGDTANRGDAPNQMGEDLPDVALGTGRTARAVAAGAEHTCALLDDATVKCWGRANVGQLGQGDTANRGDEPGEMGDALVPVALGRPAIAISSDANGNFTCALLDDGAVKCWGANAAGQLGLGSTSTRGDGPGEMGAALAAVPLGTGRTAVAVSAGADHACALLDDGSLKCWGGNDSGQLGLGDTANRGDTAGELGDALPAVALGAGHTARSVDAGSHDTCAVLDDSTLRCWGNNHDGQLGLGDTANRGDAAGEMGDGLVAVDLGTGHHVRSVSVGGTNVGGVNHTCARLDDSTLRCWGGNWSGQLGLGDTVRRGDGPGEMGDQLPVVDLGTGRHARTVDTGSYHSCALLDDLTVKCWGAGVSGVLGQGDVLDRGEAPGDMGDALPVIDLGTGVAGTIEEAGSGEPIAGAWVAALRTSDFSLAGGGIADESGSYAMSVVPGTYYLYAVDPSGAHQSGFHGGARPSVVAVGAGTVIDVDPTMATARGSIGGSVTASGTGQPLGGSWAIALSGLDNEPERVTTVGPDGHYEIDGLLPGAHWVGFIDPTGAHETRFYPSSPDVPSSQRVSVTATHLTAADGALPVQATVATGDGLTGRLVDDATGLPLPGVAVMALRAADYRLARGTTTGSDGRYRLDVVSGDYKVVFVDREGRHHMEWFDGLPLTGLPNASSVHAPGVADAALAPSTGSVSGTVTDGTTGAALSGAWVIAVAPSGIAGGAYADATGRYTLSGLAPGTYRVTFVDPAGRHRQEFWSDQPDYGHGASVTVTAAHDRSGVDAALTPT